MPNRLLSSLPCQKEGGWVLVNEFLQIPDWPGVWAVGDCALAPDLRQPGKSHPPTAQHAIREGRVVARIFGLNFSGFFAWWLWRTIYLGKLPGLDKKFHVAFDWTLDLLFHKDVCAVHDLPSPADFHRREHRHATVGDSGQYQRSAEVEATLLN